MKRTTTRTVLMLAVGTVLCLGTLHAQQHRPLPASRIYGDLQKLNTLTNVLYIAAHPDDENTRLLAWLARGRHIRTAYLSLTRGDGGQNILGSEQGAALGLIRTHELLAARELDGAEQYFTRAVDFGFSKHADETFKHWDSTVIVDDIVKVINFYRPDVIICRFPASRQAGHGHHEASAILARAAYDALPSYAKPKRLLFNAYRFGSNSTVKEDMFQMEVGQYDPHLGLGYGELAGMSRSLHRSQGAGTPSTPGVQTEYFQTLAGEPPTNSLFSGIDTTWNRVGRGDIGAAIDAIIKKFWDAEPNAVLPDLVKVKGMIRSVVDTQWRTEKLKEVDALILSCAGITADASTAQPYAVAGDTVDVAMRIVARAGGPVKLVSVMWPDGTESLNASLEHDVLFTSEHRMVIAASTIPTSPYWMEGTFAPAMYPVKGEPYPGSPTSLPRLRADATLSIAGEVFAIGIPISTKKLEPTRGDVIEELRIVPPVSIEPLASSVILGRGAKLNVRIRAFRDVKNATFIFGVTPPDSVMQFVSTVYSQSIRHANISLAANTDTVITVDLGGRTTFSPDPLVGLEIGNTTYTNSVRLVNYDHLPLLQYTEPARVKIIDEPIKITAAKVGYIEGAGDVAADVLRSLSVAVDDLTDDQIAHPENLRGYDAIVVGVRAINTRHSLTYLMPSLMKYVEGGGTVVMQYNTTRDMATDDLGPYPLKLSRDRVTEEDAPVTVLKPDARMLNTPNKILPKDYDNWAQERGLYFPTEHDARYQEIFSMHDTGEEPLRSSVLYTPFGKGHYIYCSLSLFRQLPAGVPGAMKLFANMVSMSK